MRWLLARLLYYQEVCMFVLYPLPHAASDTPPAPIIIPAYPIRAMGTYEGPYPPHDPTPHPPPTGGTYRAPMVSLSFVGAFR